MGIRGLLTAIVERKEECSETVDLIQVAKERSGIELLVDFYSFEHMLVRFLWKSLATFKQNEYLRILGAEYETIDTFVGKLVKDLKSLGISLVFFIDGSKGASNLETRQKIDTWKFRFRSECLTKRDILNVCAGQGHISELSEDAIMRSVCLEIQLVKTLRNLGCEVVQSPMGEADLTLARGMKEREKAYAVLSNDSDFCVFKDCCFIPNILFDLGGDLGLGQPLVSSRKPQRLMCGVVSAQRVQMMLQFPEEEMVIELSIIAGNDFTAPHLKNRGVTIASKLGIENHRNLFNFANWVRQYRRVENCELFRQEMEKSVDLKNAVMYSRQFYMLQNLPDEDGEKGGYIHNLIVQRIRAGVYPPHFLPMFRGFYWHRSILDDVNLCVPAEEMLAPLRALVYCILLPRHKAGVMEWGQTLDRNLTRNMNYAVDDRNLPTLNKVKDNQIFKNLHFFHYIMSHLEYSIPDKTWFDLYGRKTGFICYVLRYFLLLNWGQYLQVTEAEFLALVATAFGPTSNSAWQDMRICPDPRCVAIAGVFQDVYRHAYMFLGSILHLSHEFPLPREIFSGSKWTVLYALSGGLDRYGRVFPVSSYDQLAYIPGERLHWAEQQRDGTLHDKRHIIRSLVEGVFPFDDRRY
ncbi:uncharacterized protein LOC143287487 [Babylonia areolata]|uniref:uncharacterized protein LOC143287487 n=1 Tax=Babylonia areolata TaxID=304850 RepID=UPI003FD005C4